MARMTRIERLRLWLLRRKWLANVAVAAGIFLTVLLLREGGALTAVELEFHDVMMRLQPTRTRAESRVALIRIGESDLARYGYPLNDAMLAWTLRTLGDAAPRAVGVDLYRPNALPPGHDDLRGVIASNPRIVMIEKFPDDQGPGMEPPPFLEGTDQVGFSDFVIDPGGVVRRGLVYLWDAEETVHHSLAFRMALLYLQPEGLAPEPDPDDASGEGFLLGRGRFRPLAASAGGYVDADARGYQFLLDFARGMRPFPSYSLTDLLVGRIDPAALRDKVVILGTASPSVKDAFYTPLSRGLLGRQTIYGVELHGHAVDQLLRCALDGSPLPATWSDRGETYWLLSWSLLGAILGLRVRSPLSLSLAAAGGTAALFGVAFLAFREALWIPFAPPALAFGGSLAVSLALVLSQERAERGLVSELFARHVSRDVAREIWNQREQFMTEGRLRTQRVVLSVMMSDLKGYTSAAEKMDPEPLMAWVNQYMEAMATLIEKHGGVVDDYWGDGIKANFGVPIPRTSEAECDRDAENAVRCALAMGRKMAELNAAWAARGLETGRVRIGICTGAAVVGSLGSEQRLKYTSVGDTVNTAARLESFDKDGFGMERGTDWRVLISQETLRRIADKFETESVGKLELKGKSEPVPVYRVLGAARPKRDGQA